MEEFQNHLKSRNIQHDLEAHQQKQTEYLKDISCTICYSDITVHEEFQTNFNHFWEWYKETFHAKTYNQYTITYFQQIIIKEKEWSEKTNLQEESQNDSETKELFDKVNQYITNLIETFRYEKNIIYSYYEMVTLIFQCVIQIIQRNRKILELENLLKQMEVIEGKVLKNRFQQFWNWYQTITPVTRYTPITIKHFKILLENSQELPDQSNQLIKQNLKGLIETIIYQPTSNLNIKEIKTQVIEQFRYSKNFTLNEEETEENKKQILKTSQENTSESSNNQSPKSPNSETDSENISDTNNETNQDRNEEDDQNEEININTSPNPSFQNSDSEESTTTENSNTTQNSNNSNTNPILNLNIMNQDQLRRVLIELVGHDPADNQIPRNIGDAITNQEIILNNLLTTNQNRSTMRIVDIPTYHGRDDEDPHTWLETFNQGFITNGWPEGQNQARKINIVAGFLRDAAADWYQQDKTNITRYHDNNHNQGANNFTNRLLAQFSTPAKRNLWMTELTQLKQQQGEKVETYARKFRKLLNKATHGNELADLYQANYFIAGLQMHLQPMVRMNEPTTLNDAINRAKLVETSYTQPLNLQQIQQNNNQLNQLNNQTPNVNQSNQLNNQLNKETSIDELTEMFKKMEIKLANIENNNQRKPIIRIKNPMKQTTICRNCKKPGHTIENCYLNKFTCYSCGNKGHTSRNCPNQQTNYIDEYDNEYFYTEEDDDDEYYEDEETYYMNEYEIYEAIKGNNKNNRSRPYINRRTKQQVKFQQQEPMEQVIRQEIPSSNMETDIPKIRKKRGPNRFDKEPTYDIVEDFVNQKANITFGQLMKNSPEQTTKFRKAMVRPNIPIAQEEN